jgi:hypothetical protein
VSNKLIMSAPQGSVSRSQSACRAAYIQITIPLSGFYVTAGGTGSEQTTCAAAANDLRAGGELWPHSHAK